MADKKKSIANDIKTLESDMLLKSLRKDIVILDRSLKLKTLNDADRVELSRSREILIEKRELILNQRSNTKISALLAKVGAWDRLNDTAIKNLDKFLIDESSSKTSLQIDNVKKSKKNKK